MLRFKISFTIAICIAAFISNSFAQNSRNQPQPKAITEYVMVNGERVGVTRKSSTSINTSIQLTASYDAENCTKPIKPASIFQIINGEWKMVSFSFVPTKRKQVTDFLASGTWFIKSMPIAKDEVAIIECVAESGLVTQTEVITHKSKDVIRKVLVPDAGVLNIEIMKIKDFVKLEDKE